MAEPLRVLIPGGYGVFGSLLAAELLATTSARLVIAGRDSEKAAHICRSLGGVRCEPLALDLRDRDAFRRVASGCFAVVCAAGPFQDLDPELPLVAVEAGAHWLDISDHEGWVIPLLEKGDASAREAGRTILPGLSTVPALSGVLVRWARQRLPESEKTRITLFIGNRNRKGAGSIASAFDSEFDEAVPVSLPIGRRLAYRFRSPDRALLKKELGLDAEFRVAFEWSLANWLLPRARPRAGSRLARARFLSRLSAPFRAFGSDVSCLQAEVFGPQGNGVAEWLLARGQRLAILPAAIALEALLAGELRGPGALSPAACFEPEEWIARLSARGIRFGSEGAGS